MKNGRNNDMSVVRTRSHQRRSTRVSFHPRDDVCQFPIDLCEVDKEFVTVAEAVLRRLESLRRENNPTFFNKLFNNSRSDGGDDVVLTSDILKRFKKAVLVRLDDESFESHELLDEGTANKSSYSLVIPILITKILRYVDQVGWPEPDTEPETYYEVNQIIEVPINRQNDEIYDIIMSPLNQRFIQRRNEGGHNDGFLYFEKDDPNVAHSILPTESFLPPTLRKQTTQSHGLSQMLMMKKKIEKVDIVLEDITKFHSLEKASFEIKRLQGFIDSGGLDKKQTDYIKERIRHLQLIVQDNFDAMEF